MAANNNELFPDRIFIMLLFISATLLYSNTIWNGFLWDDRAAVIGNRDVRGETSLYDLLSHDFWGQNIKSDDSHKSYRPITVLTYRFDYYWSQLNAYGYHFTNVLIYALTCTSLFPLLQLWLSKKSAMVASLIFTFHPIHVEAVASVVGRADCLSGLFYILSLWFYTTSMRASIPFIKDVSLVLAMVLAVLSSFSKETGITVFGVFIMIEIFENIRPILRKSKYYRPKSLENKNDEETLIKPSFWIGRNILIKSLKKSVTSWQSLRQSGFRLLSVLIFTISFLYFRIRFNGGNTIYNWTVLENHINLLPSFKERSLSYAQYHFLYFWKLLYPKYLCFDYGYACVPTIQSVFDIRNLLPTLTYSLVFWLIFYAVQRVRVTLLLGIVFLIIPILPALNIIMPVGTLLAERLLFLPCLGFSIILAEFVTYDLDFIWNKLTEIIMHNRISYKVFQWLESNQNSSTGKSRRGSGSKLMNKNYPEKSSSIQWFMQQNPRTVILCILFLFPLFSSYAARVWSRNKEWKNELELFSSSMRVCPNSVKAQINFAMLTMASDNYPTAAEAALNSVVLYPVQVAALANGGIALYHIGEFAKSISLLERAVKYDPNNFKIRAYLGQALKAWATSEKDENTAKMLRLQAITHLEKAVNLGSNAPNTLFSLGAVYGEVGEIDMTIKYYQEAINRSVEKRLKFGGSLDVPVEDDIDQINAVCALASAYASKGRVTKAIETYRWGLSTYPNSFEIISNLGALYTELGYLGEAKELLYKTVESNKETVHPVILNNLGLIEMNQGNHSVAIELFEKALKIAGSIGGMSSVKSDESVEQTIKKNIQRAKMGV